MTYVYGDATVSDMRRRLRVGTRETVQLAEAVKRTEETNARLWAELAAKQAQQRRIIAALATPTMTPKKTRRVRKSQQPRASKRFEQLVESSPMQETKQCR